MNTMNLEFSAQLANEVFARTAGVAFLMQYNPSVDEVMEIKTILAEAIVNCIIHGYNSDPTKVVRMSMNVSDEKDVTIVIEDEGCGIEDLDLARQPMYTTRQDLERSGMGMTIMETFSDDFSIESKMGEGTKVTCVKRLKSYEQ